MGEIIILDKEQANTLLSLGFRYTMREIDDKNVFVFAQTKELMKELASKYDRNSFFIDNTLKL